MVLTFSYDTGERYFSVEGLFDADGRSVRAADDSTRRVANAAASDGRQTMLTQQVK